MLNFAERANISNCGNIKMSSLSSECLSIQAKISKNVYSYWNKITVQNLKSRILEILPSLTLDFSKLWDIKTIAFSIKRKFSLLKEAKYDIRIIKNCI